MNNPIKVAYIGFSGIESSVGPIISFCASMNLVLFTEKEKKEILEYDDKKAFSEYQYKQKIIMSGSGSFFPKENIPVDIDRAINGSAFKAFMDCNLIEPEGKVHRPETIITNNDSLKFNFSDIKAVKAEGFGIKLCEIFAENIRRRYIDSLCEMDPILKIYGLQENFGMLDKKHKKAIKENGISFFHRKTAE